jgi:signal transduction histidine kinase
MSRCILVVEDSRTQAEALNLLLAEQGYRVEVAPSGEEGVERARAERFDLVLSDILMPGMNGYELCRRIKGDPVAFGSPPVVLLTSLGEPVDIVRGLESGADNYVTKPYAPARLLARIRQIFETETARRARSRRAGVELTFRGERFTIGARQEQILDFFLSSFEELIETNRALQESEQALQQALAREQASRRAAEAATAARDLILATVSHDLRSPLSTILMSAGYIQEVTPVELAPKVRDKVAIIQKVVAQMNRLIQDLLDVAKIEQGHLALERRWQGAAALAHEAVEMLEPIAAERGIRIESDVPADLPDFPADRARVLQVFSNLIGNAIKFSPGGGTITLAARLEGGAVVYRISDEGPGIPAEDLPHVFDRFWSGKHRDHGGAGLGLSIARGIVETHGGRIWVESEPGRGASFCFSLPLDAQSDFDVSCTRSFSAAAQSSP